jgi:aspartate racemase
MGADFLVLPCNSAHLYLSQISESTDIPVLSMIELVRRQVQASRSGPVGLLATTNTLRTGLYNDALTGREVLQLPTREQEDLMALIADVKAGALDTGSRARCRAFVQLLATRVATSTILGCTELSVVAPRGANDVSWIDPLDHLAQAIVEMALGKTRVAELLPEDSRAPAGPGRRGGRAVS